jgi:hypothetical protein
MRAKSFSYTIASTSIAGFANGVTGTIQTTPWTTIAGAPGDGLAHTVTLASGQNLSSINITVNGLDAEGRAQSEVHAGPNNTTTTLSKFLSSLTSVSASATLGASTMSVGWTAVSITPAIPVDSARHSGPVVSITPVCSTIIQQTVTPIFTTANASVNWQSLIAVTGSAAIGVANAGVTAIRASITTAVVGSTLTMEIAQTRE